MKKQILILTMCLAMTTASAFASAPAKENPTPNPFPTPQVKKVTQSSTKIDPPAKEVPCVKPVTQSEAGCINSEQAKKKFEEKMAKDREDLYCKLGLTPEQKAKAEAMDKANREAAKPLMCKLRQEKAKFRELKEKKACPVEICKQKQQIKLAKKALKEHFETSRKCFESILTESQLAKLRTIREERKAEFKKHDKHHHHPGHKHHFGEHGCPCNTNTK